jgi:TRAP transporter TAXI family solute receptor
MIRRSFLQPLVSVVVCVLFSFGVLWSQFAAADDPSPTKVILGTATKGGGFQLFGSNLAEVINAADTGLQVEAIATKGSKENLPFLEEGKVDIGQVEGNAARQALDGIGRPAAELKVLSVMYPNPGTFVVRGDSPYKSITDLKGKPIAFGTKASGLRILVNDVLDGLGLKPDRDFGQVILKKAAEGPAMVLEKQVEALWGAGIGWPGFVKVADGPAGARFIPPSAAEIQQILEKHPHLKPMSVPAGTYKGQEAQIDSVGLWSLILVRPGLSEDVVYRLARAIHHAQGALAARLSQGRYTTAENTVAHVPAERLHPGAVRYFREAGLMK